MLVLTAFALLTPIIPNRSTKQNIEPPFARWILLILGYGFHIVGIGAGLICWYAPQTFGIQEPSAVYGVILYNIFIVLSALLMYRASRMNSDERPNVMRQIITVLIVCGITQTTLVLSLILIYSFPSEPLSSYPNEAAYNFIASITWGVLLLIMNREAVIKKVNQASTVDQDHTLHIDS